MTVAHAAARLAILYADATLLALHKPSGWFVHRTLLDARAPEIVLQSARDATGGRRLYPVHRLDRATSGVLLLARDRDTQRALCQAFAAHGVVKTYLGVVRGWPAGTGVIDAPLARIGGGASPEAQSALTRFRTVARTELPVRVDRYPSSRYALVELWPQTGRRHQLRRHLRKIDHPLISDTAYGQGRHNRLFRARFGLSRLPLAAVEHELCARSSGALLTISAPLAADFSRVVVALGWAEAVPASWRPLPETL